MLQRTFSIICSIVLVIAVISSHAGCSKNLPMAAGDVDSGYLLRYQMAEGQSWHYSINVNEKFEAIIYDLGQDLSTETISKRDFSVDFIEEDANKNISASVLLGDMSHVNRSAIGEAYVDFSHATGKTFNLMLSELGDELEYSGIEKLRGSIIPIPGVVLNIPLKSFFMDLFIDLPKKPVNPGDMWRAKKTFTYSERGFNMTVMNEVSSVLDGFEKVNNIDCLKIKINTTGTVKGFGMGRASYYMEMYGKLENAGTAYFDYQNGIMIKAALYGFTDGELSIRNASGKFHTIEPFKTERIWEIALTQKVE